MVRDRSSDVSAAYRKLMKVDTPGEKLIGIWVWEYVLKCTSDVSLIRELTESLAFPKDVPRLKQIILIKELSFQVSKDLDIKKTLDILEALDHSFEKEPVDKAGVESEDVVMSKRFKASSSEAPKANVKVRDLHEKTSSESRHDAGEESVWKGLQQPILELKEELRKLLRRSASEEVDAQNGVIESKLSALIKNAWALFGPVFLEKTEAAVINGKYKPQGVSLPLPLASGQNDTACDNGANPRNEDLSESAKRVLDECCVELQKNVNGRNKDLERARQALADSCVELGKLVKDPLPALLRKPDGTAEVPETTPGKKRQTTEPAVKRSLLESHPSALAQGWDDDEIQRNVNGRNKDLERARQALADSCVELGKLVKDPLPALLRKPDGTAEVPETTPGKKRQTTEPAVKRSLLESHPSALAQGWDDDEIQESPSRRSPSASRRLHLPPIHSPERTTLLPREPMTGESSFATGSGSKLRRQRKKWSDEEVEILKREVHKYGKGNWKAILQKNKDVFHGRTEVDMKDKWRNLEKYGLL